MKTDAPDEIPNGIIIALILRGCEAAPPIHLQIEHIETKAEKP